MEQPKAEPEPEPAAVPPAKTEIAKKAQTFALVFLILSILTGTLAIVFGFLSSQSELYLLLSVLFTTAAAFSILFCVLFGLLYLPARSKASRRIR
ncbi:MAG: hypothetical protein BWY98_01333 [Tenericutes bacterium ADurb.BinA155]|jgi:uncharacterized RDD family membrane protein YckC|nr:MAG: hypothetical protein BWY98_01333 [Tenericutes bacterium ADurb.BinA155]